MLTPAERNSLFLTLGFLLLGAGIKGWKKWRVEIGPFEPAAPAAAAPLDRSRTGDTLPAAPGDTASEDISHLALHGTDSSGGHPVEMRSGVDTLPAGPRKPSGHARAKSPKSASACPVDLNTASEAGLAELPGVGPRTAAALSAHRKSHGPFREIREILKVKGIGEKKLALISPCLVLSGAGSDPLPAPAGADPEAGGEGEAARP